LSTSGNIFTADDTKSEDSALFFERKKMNWSTFGGTRRFEKMGSHHFFFFFGVLFRHHVKLQGDQMSFFEKKITQKVAHTIFIKIDALLLPQGKSRPKV
jgi:hypothetical protein